MILKVSGNTPERFSENLKKFLDMATLICHKGYIPTQRDIDNAPTHGNWWHLNEEQQKYYILGSSNNIWIAIHSKNENCIYLEFSFRYDSKKEKENAINQVLLVFLDFVEEVN